MSIYLPEQFKIVNGSPVATTNGGITCDFVSLKNVNMAWILVEALQAGSHATVLNPQRATDPVTPTGNVAIAHAANWWKNVDISLTDTLIKQTAATTMSLTAGIVDQQVLIQIDPAQLGATYDAMGLVVTTSGDGTNFMTVTYFLEMRYAQATPPTALT